MKDIKSLIMMDGLSEMPKFECQATAYYKVIIEAEDTYEADEIFRNMKPREVVEKGALTFVSTDMSELPQEV
jgi:hypothetical protein